MRAKMVLIVDDEVNTCIKLSKLLGLTGKYTTITANNGQDAIQILDSHSKNIDCVVTDMYMPKKSGLDVISHIRQNKLPLQVVLISGGDRSADIPVEQDSLLNMAAKYGQVKFLKKPFKVRELDLLLSECEGPKH